MERKLLFGLIKSLFSETENLDIPKNITESQLKTLYTLSEKHDIAHLLAFALEKNGIDLHGETGKLFFKQKMLSIYRREQIDFEEERITSVFREEKIPFIPLKGAVIKNFYPEKWMRTSCDIDILVKPEDFKKAVTILLEKEGFLLERSGSRDYSLVSKRGVNLELHFAITNEIDKRVNSVLERVWEFATPKKEGDFLFETTNEFLLFHTIAHAQYHFMDGGCGIRPVLDLWFLEKELHYSKETLSNLLNETGSFDFHKGLESLSKVWFENKEYDDLTSSLEDYILQGGVFGSRFNLGATGSHKKGGWRKYILNRIFMPKEKLELKYPSLKKHPLLLPFYHVRRWFGLLKKENRKEAFNEFQGRRKGNATTKMLDRLGL